MKPAQFGQNAEYRSPYNQNSKSTYPATHRQEVVKAIDASSGAECQAQDPGPAPWIYAEKMKLIGNELPILSTTKEKEG